MQGLKTRNSSAVEAAACCLQISACYFNNFADQNLLHNTGSCLLLSLQCLMALVFHNGTNVMLGVCWHCTSTAKPSRTLLKRAEQMPLKRPELTASASLQAASVGPPSFHSTIHLHCINAPSRLFCRSQGLSVLFVCISYACNSIITLQTSPKICSTLEACFIISGVPTHRARSVSLLKHPGVKLSAQGGLAGG